jgi:hypothetical protein
MSLASVQIQSAFARKSYTALSIRAAAAGRRSYAMTTATTVSIDATSNPYRILNVPVNSNYETVKAAFIKAALQHHPDHSRRTDTGAAFVRVRRAFEEIVSGRPTKDSDGDITDNTDSAAATSTVWKSDAEFQEWFRAETGEFLSFDMTHDTRQEVIQAYRTMASSSSSLAFGADKGGYWEMARRLAERENCNAVVVTTTNSDAAVTKQLSAGGAASLSTANLRRKRRHR